MIKNTNKSSLAFFGNRATWLLAAVLVAVTAVSPAFAASRTRGAHRPADINKDGVVDRSDLLILVGDFTGRAGCRTRTCRSDLNGDGRVDGLDLAILLAEFD